MAKIVNPAVEAQPLVLLLAAEFEGGSRHLLDVGVARCRGDRCWAPYPVVEPGSVRCRLGRVLGQVVTTLDLAVGSMIRTSNSSPQRMGCSRSEVVKVSLVRAAVSWSAAVSWLG